jgi:UDP-N-acetyl-2-amino-2-deoxyglucuronate dehydrogenase
MNDQKFKFAIVGSGNIANTYIAAVGKIENAEIAGIISRSLTKPAALTGDSRVLVADSLTALEADVDAVIICTPNGLHHTAAI